MPDNNQNPRGYSGSINAESIPAETRAALKTYTPIPSRAGGIGIKAPGAGSFHCDVYLAPHQDGNHSNTEPCLQPDHNAWVIGNLLAEEIYVAGRAPRGSRPCWTT
jgi:hypothetical protein